MKLHQNIYDLPAFEKAVITIGTFDGVHKGHQEILLQLVSEARKIEGTPVVITFHPHPREIIKTNDVAISQLTSLEEKATLLSKLGIEHLVVIPFTKEFSEMSADNYIKEFLIKNFHPQKIIIGYDHRFGKDRLGDFSLLKIQSIEHHFELIEIPEKTLTNNTISSTAIRKLILEGDISSANELLGYEYHFSGKVVKGNQLGRTIQFPTANIEFEYYNKLIPADGVYIIECAIGGKEHLVQGMMNIGFRPTIDGTNRIIETHLFDFNEEIYDASVTIYVIKKLRDEKKFANLDELKKQLTKDKEMSVAYFTSNTP